jgi:predicted nucleic acid-binding protein
VILVDTNVLLDLVLEDRTWADWSQHQLESASIHHRLAINPVIYSELSIAFARIEELESMLADAALAYEEIPCEALFLAGKAFVDYRRRRGAKSGVLPDFYIGAHAAVAGWSLLTRDASRYRSYFPTVRLLAPDP